VPAFGALGSTGKVERKGEAKKQSEGSSACPARSGGFRTYRVRRAESRFNAFSNFFAIAGVLKSPVRISRSVASRP
jgi:hypothetical protein